MPETNYLKCNYAHKPLTGREIFDLYSIDVFDVLKFNFNTKRTLSKHTCSLWASIAHTTSRGCHGDAHTPLYNGLDTWVILNFIVVFLKFLDVFI